MIFKEIKYDVKAVMQRDPAARNFLEVLLLYQGEIVGNFSEEEKKKLSVTDLYKIMVELDEKDN